ncbi:molybdenum cofactor biosynthesis protein MoaE [Hyphobacterium sp.]|uniref:molybdenum cofactor biosynthesis protein MoaE n=1 Tax=Hyphobacterium sp. TaxID=2004662 RepID=UPI003BAC0A97
MANLHVHLTGERLDIPALDRALPDNLSVGGIASFTGRVRKSEDLTALELQHHPVMTEPALRSIGESALDRFSLTALLIAHRHGRMPPGEPIVHIIAQAPHRRAALDAVAFTIDVLKTEAPFWKREWRGDSAVWIEPTSTDHREANQWLETGT